MRVTKLIGIFGFLAVAPIFAVTQDGSSPQRAPIVKRVPITNTPPYSGKAMFKSYCVVCHGTAAKGDGPAASALKTQPADLTLLAQKNGGKYPSGHVASVIRGQASLVSHGTQEMPIWGPLFSSLGHGSEAQVQQRISNLVAYIKTLQAK